MTKGDIVTVKKWEMNKQQWKAREVGKKWEINKKYFKARVVGRGCSDKGGPGQLLEGDCEAFQSGERTERWIKIENIELLKFNWMEFVSCGAKNSYYIPGMHARKWQVQLSARYCYCSFYLCNKPDEQAAAQRPVPALLLFLVPFCLLRGAW